MCMHFVGCLAYYAGPIHITRSTTISPVHEFAFIIRVHVCICGSGDMRFMPLIARRNIPDNRPAHICMLGLKVPAICGAITLDFHLGKASIPRNWPPKIKPARKAANKRCMQIALTVNMRPEQCQRFIAKICTLRYQICGIWPLIVLLRGKV